MVEDYNCLSPRAAVLVSLIFSIMKDILYYKSSTNITLLGALRCLVGSDVFPLAPALILPELFLSFCYAYVVFPFHINFSNQLACSTPIIPG